MRAAQVIREAIERGEEILPPAEIRLTDTGNARRFAKQHGERVRYCHPWGTWLYFDGRRWAHDDTAQVRRLASITVSGIYTEAASASTADERRAIAAWALQSESAKRLRDLLDLARSEPGVPVLPDELDRDPWALNVDNGLVDLRTGAMRAHDPADLVTKLAPVVFDPDARCPLFLASLDRIMAGKLGMIEFLQRSIGYTLTGSTRERVLWLFCGGGDNGKSTLLETVAAMLGDYAATAPSRTLMAKRDDGIPNDVARLKGSRFVSVVETEESRRLDVELVKRMTGGADKLSARFMRGEWFDFSPTFKLFLATNHKPVVRDTTESIWRRIKLVPFTVAIPEAEQDKTLPEKLRGELSGVLNWALEGCLSWQRSGLGVPPEVTDATASYRGEMDSLAQFLEDSCTVNSSAWATAADLYGAYRKWCEQTGERIATQTRFGRMLGERGFDRERGTGGRVKWFGIGLRE